MRSRASDFVPPARAACLYRPRDRARRRPLPRRAGGPGDDAAGSAADARRQGAAGRWRQRISRRAAAPAGRFPRGDERRRTPRRARSRGFHAVADRWRDRAIARTAWRSAWPKARAWLPAWCATTASLGSRWAARRPARWRSLRWPRWAFRCCRSSPPRRVELLTMAARGHTRGCWRALARWPRRPRRKWPSAAPRRRRDPAGARRQGRHAEGRARRGLSTNPTLARRAGAAARDRRERADRPRRRAAQRQRATGLTPSIPVQAPGSFIAPARSAAGTLNLTVPIYRAAPEEHIARRKPATWPAGPDLRGSESSLFSQVVAAYMDVILNEASSGSTRTTSRCSRSTSRSTTGPVPDRPADADRRRPVAIAPGAGPGRSPDRAIEPDPAQASITSQLVGKAPIDLQPPPPLPGLPVNVDAAVKTRCRRIPT